MISNFQFSQAGLQDYIDCPRRFELKYLLNLSWPAVCAEPVRKYEKYLHQGILFHRLVQQHIMGVSEDKISELIDDKDLSRWWKNYLKNKPLYGKTSSEVVVSAKMGRNFLVARYDLINIEKGKGKIIDWKTSRKMPQKKWLAERLQTKVYLFLLVKSGYYLYNNHYFKPEDIEMVYWFANFPWSPVVFQYNSYQYKKDEEYLNSIINEIANRKEDFPVTDKRYHCTYCIYRSLCNRGILPGLIENFEGEIDLTEKLSDGIDFE